jgi:hypothetical protein
MSSEDVPEWRWIQSNIEMEDVVEMDTSVLPAALDQLRWLQENITQHPILLETSMECPLCGTSVRFENYFAHLAEYHPISYQLWVHFTSSSFLNTDTDIDQMSYDELLELCNHIGYHSVGLTEAQKEQATEPIQTADARCTICLSSLDSENSENSEDWVALRRCRHSFCKGCIYEWLDRHKTCPVCIQDVLPDSEE